MTMTEDHENIKGRVIPELVGLLHYMQLSDRYLMFVDDLFVIQQLNVRMRALFREFHQSFATYLPQLDCENLIGTSFKTFYPDSDFLFQSLSHLQNESSLNMRVDDLLFSISVTPIEYDQQRFGYLLDWKEESQEILLLEQIEAIANAIHSRPQFERMGADSVGQHYLISKQLANHIGDDFLSVNSINLKEALNSILENLKHTTLDEIQTERVNTIGFMATGIAHEINNPLSGVLANMMYLKVACVDATVLEIVDENIDELTRVTKIVQGLLGFGRSDQVNECHATSVHLAMEHLIQLIHLQLKSIEFVNKKGVSIVNNVPTHLQLLNVMMNENHLIQILLNLVNNAVQAVHEAKTDQPQVIIDAVLSDDQQMLIISVTDNGPGVPEAIRKNIFMPFFTTKAAGKGTGMGLALSQNMAMQCKGQLYLDIGVVQGCRFSLKVPIELQSSHFDMNCFSTLKGLLGKDLSSIVLDYITNSEKLVSYIHDSFEQHNFNLLRADVLRLKSASLSVCAKLVRDTCRNALVILEDESSDLEKSLKPVIVDLERGVMETIIMLRQKI